MLLNHICIAYETGFNFYKYFVGFILMFQLSDYYY